MTKVITMRIDEETLQKLYEYAKIENRSLSNFIETAAKKYVNELEYTGEYEMKTIKTDKVLMNKLKRGSEDAKNKRGRFVKL
jgi:hypothetical protein